MATGKNWRSQNTVWLQVQKWTTKSRRKDICIWYHVCVVKPSTTPMTTWPPRPRTPSTQRTWTLTRECAVLFVGQVRVVMIHIALHGSRVLRTSFHPCMMSVSLRPWVLHSLLLHLLSLALHPHFFHFLEGRSEPVHSAEKGMDSLDELAPSQVMSPKSLRLSQGSPGKSIHIFFDGQKEVGEQGHQAPITEEVKDFGEIGTHVVPDSKRSETSYFQLHMHFDDSAESIADPDLEDGELQKMLTSPLYAQKASGKPDAMVVQEREVSAHLTQADRKFEVSFIWRSESVGETRCMVFERKCSPKYSTPKYARNGRNKESSRTTNGWGLSAKVKRKSRDNSSAAHFPIAANARTGEFYEWSGDFQDVDSN